jgi:hypothetical protein
MYLPSPVVHSRGELRRLMSTGPTKLPDRARLESEYQECLRKILATEAELKRIGAAFVELGNRLQTEPSGLSEHRLLVEKDLAVLWLLLPEYLEALEDREARRATLDALK